MAAKKTDADSKDTSRPATPAQLLEKVRNTQAKSKIPDFRPGDTVRVHNRIIEGSKERIQVFEGVVTKRHHGTRTNATFTVRKVSYNVGVERTFLLHSPRVERIELVTNGEVRRARLFYLRDLRGRAAKIKGQVHEGEPETAETTTSENEAEDSTFTDEVQAQAAQ